MSSSAQFVQLKSTPLYSKGVSGYVSQSPVNKGSGRESRGGTERNGDSTDRGALHTTVYGYSPNKLSSFYSSHGASAPERYSHAYGSQNLPSSGVPAPSGSVRRTPSGSHASTLPSAPPISVPSILDKVPSHRGGGALQSLRGVSSHATSSGTSSGRTSYPATTLSNRTPLSSINASTSEYSSEVQRPRRHKTFSSDDSPRHISRNPSFSSNASGFSNDSTDLWSNSSPTYSSPRQPQARPASPSSTCSDATSLVSQRSSSVPARHNRRLTMSSEYPDPSALPTTNTQNQYQTSYQSAYQSSYQSGSQYSRGDKLERERPEREMMDRQVSDRDRSERERLERERLERDRAERERSERDRAERERSERARLERDRLEREKLERFRPERGGMLEKVNSILSGIPSVASLAPPPPVAVAVIQPPQVQRTFDRTAVTRLIKSSKPGQGCVGLSNLGNTCFMNSIIQCLNAVPELVAEFQQPKMKWSDKAYVAPAYAHLVCQMWSCSYGSVFSPNNFLRAVSKYDNRWGSGRQQDSQEFLHSLLAALQSECNRITEKPKYLELQGKGSEQQQADEADRYARSWNDSVIDDIFGGQLQSTIECQVCKRQSHCFDPFLGLCVQMPNSKKGLSVASCMAGFVETEKLDKDESYKCEGCKKFQPATKRLQIYRYPRVLVLTLKRFSASSTFARFSFTSKNSSAVSIDHNHLDLSQFCNPAALKRFSGAMAPPVYKLIAVSNHSGSLGGGHYTAQCRSVADGKWCDFNDSSVSRDSPPDSSSSSAYVLFYRLVQADSSP